MKRKLLSLAVLPMALATIAGADTHYGSFSVGHLNVWAGGGTATAYAQTSGNGGSGDVTVSVSLTPSGPGCSGWVTASNSGSGWTSAQADAPLSCSANSATGAAFHTWSSGGGYESYSTYAVQ